MFKRILIPAGSVVLVSALFVISNQNDESTAISIVEKKSIPIPTQVYEHMQDEAGFGERKRNYFDHIHGNYPNWREINEQNFRSIYEWRKEMRANKTPEIFANGAFEATWIERGSNNLAGNVQISDFDTVSEKLYAISDGGTLWKGDLDDEDWTPLNEDIQFGSRVLKVFRLSDNTLRIFAARGHGIFYSDDEGQNWTQAAGFTSDWSYGSAIDLVRLNDAQKTLVYLYNAYNFGWASYQNRLAYSIDDGETWTITQNFSTTNNNFASMHAPYGSARTYIINGNDESYFFENTTLTALNSSLNLNGSSTCYLTSNMTSTDTTLYVLMDNEELYKSTNGGNSYTFVSTLPVSSWEAGITVSIDNPNILYMGEMELWRSTNGGISFTKVNEWWEYYDDVDTKIHADIMSITAFKKSNGDEFTVIPNHGGVSISYDNLATTENIGLLNLNVGQLYDVLTSTINSDYVFAGSQDQGFQRSLTGNSTSSSYFEQVISGDYGQMQFVNNGQGMFIQYPGGDFAFYENVMTDGWSQYWHDIQGNDMANYNWIVPTEGPADPADDYILVGGGEISGGSGSYLIKLQNEGSSASMTQFDFDFLAASGGTISAIGVTPLDENRMYVTTENGKFFYSEDGGDNWTMTVPFNGPGGDWIFGADIYASKLTPDLVFVGGAGYSTDAVHMSTDGGESFEGIWPSSLPETAVHEMCMDPQEKYLFAATDAGPYVYVMAEEEWYSLLGLSAPVQEYMCVEYVQSENVVRFGTWGRGIWDLKMNVVAGVNENDLAENKTVYPNPSVDGNVNIQSESSQILIVYDAQGKQLVRTTINEGLNQINLSHLPKGSYVLVTMNTVGVIEKNIWVKL